MNLRIVGVSLALLLGLLNDATRADCEGSGSDGSGGSSSDIVNSWDPNEMAGPLGFGDPATQRFVRPGEWMDYIVYFENKSNATAAAQEVFVDADLSPLLDWTTFELGEEVFNNQTESGLLGQNSGTLTVPQNDSPYQVRIQFNLNPTNGAARWYLRSYDPSQSANGYWPEEVTAGFLPPNDDTFRGEGHLAYRIKVRDDAPPGALIQAAAEIIFDQNAMIPTDPSWWNTVADTNAAGAIQLSGDLAFRYVTTNMTARRTLQIRETGGAAPLTVYAITHPEGFDGTWSGIIPAGGSTNLTITFTPRRLGSHAGDLVVESGATGGVDRIAASGYGTWRKVDADFHVQHGLAPDGSEDFEDTDNDEFTNWEEWLAQTDPTDSNSFFRVGFSPTSSVSQAGITLSWPSITGRTYEISVSTNLLSNPGFTILQTAIPGQPDYTTHTDTNQNTDPLRIYRVSIETD